MSYYNAILIETYTRPTQQCHFEWLWVTLSDLAKWQEALHDLSATAELLVLLLFVSVLLLWINSTIRRLTNLTCRRTWSRSLLRCCCCCCCCWLISRIPVWLTDSRLTSGCWRPPYAKHLGVTSLQQLDATESCCWQKRRWLRVNPQSLLLSTQSVRHQDPALAHAPSLNSVRYGIIRFNVPLDTLQVISFYGSGDPTNSLHVRCIRNR